MRSKIISILVLSIVTLLLAVAPESAYAVKPRINKEKSSNGKSPSNTKNTKQKSKKTRNKLNISKAKAGMSKSYEVVSYIYNNYVFELYVIDDGLYRIDVTPGFWEDVTGESLTCEQLTNLPLEEFESFGNIFIQHFGVNWYFSGTQENLDCSVGVFFEEYP